jgi:YbbR domain-containing protein
MSRNLLTRNFGWKLLSLALAIVIWVTIKTVSAEQGQAEKMYVNLPIQVVSGTADVRACTLEPNQAQVTLKGKSDLINSLNEREIHVLVDVTSADLTHSFRQRVAVTIPNGLSVVRIEPTEIQITPPPKPQPKIFIGP